MSGGQSVADVLERAADLIEQEGAWTREQIARDSRGNPLWRATHPSAVCFCMGGAVMAAAGGNPPEGWADFVKAAIGERQIATWNDARSRTQAEVVAKLREAAAIARTKTGEA